jgi:anti-sigma-K factor RskA
MNGPDERAAMLELVAAHALGVLPPDEQPRVTAFIAADPEARREYDALRPVADLVGLAAEAPPDPARAARMKARLMTSVRGLQATRSAPTPARSMRPMVWISALAAAAALVFALGSAMKNVDLSANLADANRRAAALQQEVTAERAAVRRDARILADLSAPDAKRYAVAYGAVITRRSHVYLAFDALPALPRGRVYQAWTLARGANAVAPSITFTPNADGTTLVPLPEDATGLTAIALSVEPAGGSRAPTTKPAFIQPLS